MVVTALTAVGVLVVVVGLAEIFRTLLRPTGQGPISAWVLRVLWSVSRSSGHRVGPLVGPAAMLSVVTLWVFLQVLGWALIYLPHVPDGFHYPAGVDPADYSPAAEAVYLSMVTLSTLGYGDVIPTEPWVRALSPLQALSGFVLLTAGITWFSQIPPALSRRRALALQLKSLADTSFTEHLGQGDPTALTRVLDSLATAVVHVGIDFAQHSEGYYFRERDPDLALAHHLSYLLRVRDTALAVSHLEVLLSGRRLALAVDQLGTVLDDAFFRSGQDAEHVFATYALEHRHDPE